VACAITLSLAGCQSRAHRDAYIQKMASEIRVLEDQLYDADYQNRILRDKLERARAVPTRDPEYSDIHGIAPYGSKYEPPSVLDSRIDDSRIDTGALIDSEPSVPEPVPLPQSDAAESDDEIGLPQQLPKEPEREDGPKKRRDKPLPPPPGGPEPPGIDDLQLPEIDPGEIIPPPLGIEDRPPPPGKVDLPESLRPKREQIRPPKSLAIHPALSGGHQFDDEPSEGLYLVVNAIDDRGRMVDLSAFDIGASMTVVALDPALPSSKARIGRWEFSPEQVGDLVRSDPVNGLHVPLQWQEHKPQGEDVIVHVRLRSGDEEMKCDAELSVQPATATATWTPRGQATRR
jgi:hypothetical protein